MKIFNSLDSEHVSSKKVGFTSKNFPVKPFVVNTKSGPIFINEVNQLPLKIDGIFNFYLKGVEGMINKPQGEIKPLSFLEKKMLKIKFSNYFGDMLNQKNGNPTILIGENSNGETKAFFCLSDYINMKFGITDPKTGLFQSFMVSSELRSEGIGTICLNELLKIAEKQYKSVFLTARKGAINLYKRAGFQEPDLSNQNILSDMKVIANDDSLSEIPMFKTFEPKDNWAGRILNIIHSKQFDQNIFPANGFIA